MAKRKKHKRSGQASKHSAPATEPEWQAQIQALLAQHKTREAVEAAKQFLKQAPGPDAQAAAITAYQARIQALIASGLAQEAHALALLASERFPASENHFRPLIRQTEVSTGQLDGLLTELATAEGERRRALEAVLARGLTDPAQLIHTSALPAEHPLKRQATLIHELFTAVTTAPLPDGALSALDTIPRQSPLAPWKLLIRTLDAFYRRADQLVEANLARIPLDSGPGRLVPVIRALIGDAEGQASQPSANHAAGKLQAAGKLIDLLSGGQYRLHAQLNQLSHALHAKNERQALAALQHLLPWLSAAPAQPRQTFLATLLHHWQRNDLSPHGLMDLLMREIPDPEIVRLVALTVEHLQWDGALILWDDYLTAAQATRQPVHSAPERAQILLHMAQLFPSDPEDVCIDLGVESEREIQQLIRAGNFPPAFDRAALLDRARQADPRPAVFQALVAHYEHRDPKRAEAEAEAWRQAYPHDLDPLLYLVRATEQRGALRKALDFLTKAEAINRVHPQVRQSRFRLLLASAERRIKEGKASLALTDLEHLAREPRANDGDIKAYLLALSWAVAHLMKDAAGMERIAKTLSTTVNNPTLQTLLLSAVSHIVKLPGSQWSSKSPPSQAIEALARACELFRTVGRPLSVPDSFLKQIEKNLDSASVTQLHALCQGGLALGRPSLTYIASGHGLAHQAPHLHRFLLARGLCLSLNQHEYTRARQCLRAARELANRARDMEAVSQASAALDSLPAWGEFGSLLFGAPRPAEAPPSHVEINQTIALERRRKTPPRVSKQALGRKSCRTAFRPRLPRHLFNDMLSFLEEDFV